MTENNYSQIRNQYPDLRDGLTFTERSILYVLNHNHHTSSGRYTKSANLIGEILCYYAPYGDSFVYSALTKMVQQFQNNYPLLLGEGNFGSRENPEPAAYRYTECKLSKFGDKMVEDINNNFVLRETTLDEHREVPVYLPSSFPHLLCNGNHEICGHDIKNVKQALLSYLENPKTTTAGLAAILKAPKFSDGRILITEDFSEYYETGKMDIQYRYKNENDIHTFKAQNNVLVDNEQRIVNLKEMIAAFVLQRKAFFTQKGEAKINAALQREIENL